MVADRKFDFQIQALDKAVYRQVAQSSLRLHTGRYAAANFANITQRSRRQGM
jgi:hypothetical protein